jgi:hypothetical protein
MGPDAITPTSARDELRRLVMAKLLEVTGVEIDGIAADGIMRLFFAVEDEWDRTYITTWGDGGNEKWLDQRYLVARVPVQTVAGERRVERGAPS